jgi:hypothetical protein
LADGKHEMVFQAESNKGAIKDLGTIPVIVINDGLPRSFLAQPASRWCVARS